MVEPVLLKGGQCLQSASDERIQLFFIELLLLENHAVDFLFEGAFLMVVDQVDGEDTAGLLESEPDELADVVGLRVHFGELVVVTNNGSEFLLVSALVVLDDGSPLVGAVLHEHVLTQVSVPALADELVGGREFAKCDFLAGCLHALGLDG